MKTISIVLLDNLLCLLFEEILLDFPLPVIRTHYLTCKVQNYIPLCPRLSDTGFLCVHIKKIIGIGFPSIAAINLLHLLTDQFASLTSAWIPYWSGCDTWCRFFRGVRFPWGDTIRVQRGSNSRWGSSRHFVFYLCWGFLAKWDSVCLIVPIYIYVLDPEEVERSIPLSQVIDWIILSESHMLGRRRLWVNLFLSLLHTVSLTCEKLWLTCELES